MEYVKNTKFIFKRLIDFKCLEPVDRFKSWEVELDVELNYQNYFFYLAKSHVTFIASMYFHIVYN